MTLIEILVTVEIVIGLVLLLWLLKKAFHHAKKSPAELALQAELAELQEAKESQKSPPPKLTKTGKESKK